MSRSYKDPNAGANRASDRTKSANSRDPRHRHYDGARLWNELIDADPTKKYIWVNKSASDQGQGISFYEGLGYELVLRSADGKHPRPARGKTISEGSSVEMRGNVLMCIDREEHEAQYKYGWDGQSGQSQFDEIEEQIVGKGLSDEMAKRSRSYMRLRNESKISLSHNEQ